MAESLTVSGVFGRELGDDPPTLKLLGAGGAGGAGGPHPFIAIGGGGGGGAGADGGGGGGLGGVVAVVTGTTDCFRLGLVASLLQ